MNIHASPSIRAQRKTPIVVLLVQIKERSEHAVHFVISVISAIKAGNAQERMRDQRSTFPMEETGNEYASYRI